MKLSQGTKDFLLLSTDCAILGALAELVRQHWDQAAFQDFLKHRSYTLWLVALYGLVLCAMPLLPKPEKRTGMATATTKFQAWTMLLTTWAIDYLVLGALMLLWNTTVPLGNDGKYCPFAAAATLAPLLMIMPLKEDLQIRVLFRDFTARAKLNNWPYTPAFMWDILSRFVSFNVLGVLAYAALGLFDGERITSPAVLGRIWLESMVEARLIDMVGMYIMHKWMPEYAYFLHKKHHTGKSNLGCIDCYRFDVLDLVFEFGGGVMLTCLLKYALGMNPTVHFMSYGVALYAGINVHSANPYAIYFLNPLMDYLGRQTLCHNLHHTVQLDYYTGWPSTHFLSAKARQEDIARYNKDMKTAFPPTV